MSVKRPFKALRKKVRMRQRLRYWKNLIRCYFNDHDPINIEGEGYIQTATCKNCNERIERDRHWLGGDGWLLEDRY